MLPSLPWPSNAVSTRVADADGCACRHAFTDPPGPGRTDRVELVVDADDCDGGGDLATRPACRAAAVAALAERDADVVRVRDRGLERRYVDDAAAFLVAAGRFVDLVGFHDARLAVRTRTDPLAAAHEATGRAGPVADLAVETGLAEGAARADGYEDALRAFVGPAVAHSRVDPHPPEGVALADSRTLTTGATVRRYRSGDDLHYHLTPVEADLGGAELAALDDAAAVLARGDAGTGERAPGRAVRHVAADDDPVDALTAVLRKHTHGNGVLDDLFADPRIGDVYVTAPAAANPVRVRVDGETASTNVRLTPGGVAALASRVRRASGRAFSRATPRVDASLRAGDDDVRVAGVTRPLSEGPAFAFRRHDDAAWTLPRLVASGTVPPGPAALLSLAVERGATGLVAGGRGAGKTATLEALVRELPRRTRTVLLEDTPELPVAALQASGRDVQALRVAADEASGETTPAEALRTALRLGDGALVVGEVRGPEARVLYEAMRVGAAAGAVLGTVHGADGEAVRERMVTDLGVPESSFAATDLVATMVADGPGGGHQLARLEEVRRTASGTAVVPLYHLGGGGPEPTGVVGRGDSELVASLAAADETYADVRAALDARAERFADHVTVAGREDTDGAGAAEPAKHTAVSDEP